MGGALLFAIASGGFVAAVWATTALVDDPELKLAAVFVVGLGFLLAVIAGVVAWFSALKLTSPRSALGLPEGSIRAIVALVLILIFVVMAIYLVEAVYVGPNANPDAENVATQLLAMVGTLVAAVAAFYFGSAAVTTGSNAATAAAMVGRGRAPEALTKGSEVGANGYKLVGIINPHGRDTTYWFEYGPTPDYGSRTAATTAGAGDAAITVESEEVGEVREGWHLRLAAESDAGKSYGSDAKVTEPVRGDGSGYGGNGAVTGYPSGNGAASEDTPPSPVAEPSPTVDGDGSPAYEETEAFSGAVPDNPEDTA